MQQRGKLAEGILRSRQRACVIRADQLKSVQQDHGRSRCDIRRPDSHGIDRYMKLHRQGPAASIASGDFDGVLAGRRRRRYHEP